MDDKYSDIALGLRRIKVTQFNVNEPLYRSKGDKVTLDVGIRNESAPEFDMLNVIMRVVFRYIDTDFKAELASIEVNSSFEVVNLKNYVDKENRILLPEEIWLSIASMVVGHTRALFADRLAGTVFQTFMIPILDAESIVERFFPTLVAKEKAST